MATKGIPSVPDVPQQLTEDDIYRILDPLKRIIDIRQGRFDPLDRWVTQQDLIDAGLQTESSVESPVVVIPPTQQYPFTLTGDINGGPTTMGTGNPTSMSTIINLPNVTEVFGGDAAETFPSQPQGPYGVVSGGGGGGGGKVVDFAYTLTGASSNGTGTFPNDNSIPESSEGNEVMTLAHTPANASNILRIDVSVNVSASANDDVITVALFQDSTVNALGCAYMLQDLNGASGSAIRIQFTHVMVAGTASSTTFKVRVGATSGTTTFNGHNSAQSRGGSLASSIIITELTP